MDQKRREKVADQSAAERDLIAKTQVAQVNVNNHDLAFSRLLKYIGVAYLISSGIGFDHTIRHNFMRDKSYVAGTFNGVISTLFAALGGVSIWYGSWEAGQYDQEVKIFNENAQKYNETYAPRFELIK